MCGQSSQAARQLKGSLGWKGTFLFHLELRRSVWLLHHPELDSEGGKLCHDDRVVAVMWYFRCVALWEQGVVNGVGVGGG